MRSLTLMKEGMRQRVLDPRRHSIFYYSGTISLTGTPTKLPRQVEDSRDIQHIVDNAVTAYSRLAPNPKDIACYNTDDLPYAEIALSLPPDLLDSALPKMLRCGDCSQGLGVTLGPLCTYLSTIQPWHKRKRMKMVLPSSVADR